MKQVFIKFSTAQQVVDFVNIMSQCEYDVDLKAGSITVDAKSIVGVFSMAKANQLEVVLHMDDTDIEAGAYEKWMEKISPFAA